MHLIWVELISVPFQHVLHPPLPTMADGPVHLKGEIYIYIYNLKTIFSDKMWVYIQHFCIDQYFFSLLLQSNNRIDSQNNVAVTYFS